MVRPVFPKTQVALRDAVRDRRLTGAGVIGGKLLSGSAHGVETGSDFNAMLNIGLPRSPKAGFDGAWRRHRPARSL